MKIGYACTPLLVPYKTTRKFLIKAYSDDLMINYTKLNLEDLMNILIYNYNNGIDLFRISSDIIPFGSHYINTFPWWDHFKDELIQIGDFIKNNGLRVSMHPGQYTVLNSPTEEIVDKAIMDLEYHADFLNALGLDSTHKIIIHIGGVYGNKESATNRFIENYFELSESVKQRLIIENDEKNFSIDDVLYISEKTGAPVIFDNLHNSCFNDNSYTLEEILTKVSKTWSEKDGNMKVHYSQQNPLKKKGSHSISININEFLDYLSVASNFDIDIMLEVKDKNISCIKVINTIEELEDGIQLNSVYEEFDKYKLFFEEKKSSLSDFPSSNDLTSFNVLYKIVDDLIYTPSTDIDFINTIKKVYLLLENNLNTKEINHFNKLLIDEKFIKCKEYLQKMSIKYNNPINESYYFIY
ncbi:UV DNA damage repair endonuclease UvsE [Clostridium sp.]|uniref:UV DNA damage repair endonuclease UvsE n=1 Tax=Clostridium sp. TaxID=1506 RepID=UPI003F2B4072